MKNWLSSVIIGQVLHSKKFVYAITALVVPFLMNKFGWGADVAESVWQTFLVLILGQGIADINKR